MRWRAPAWMILAALLVSAVSAAAADVTEWKWARRILQVSPGWTVIELDGPVFAGSKPDLGDLRILTAERQEIPWQVVPRPEPVVVAHPVRLFDLFADGTAGRTTFTLDIGSTGRITNRIVLRTDSRDFFKRLAFEASNDLRTWQPLGGGDYVYDMSSKRGGSRLDASYPPTSYRYLRVTVEDLGTPPLAGLAAEMQHVQTPAAEERALGLLLVDRTVAGGAAVSTVDLGYRGIPAHRIRIATRAEAFHRPALIEGSDDRSAWRSVASGTLYRYGTEHEQLSLPLGGSRYRFYRITIQGGDDVPILPESVSMSTEPTRLLFRAPEGRDLFLLYGNPQAQRPAYDGAPFREAGAGSAVPAQLGRQLSVMTEPEVVRPTADPPKSDADPRVWRYVRDIGLAAALSVPQFVQLRLDLHILAGARADLGDLRLADENGADVPFQVRSDRNRAPETWPYAIANSAAEGQETWWVLDLGAVNTPSESVRFSAREQNLRADVKVDGSNDGKAWQGIAGGRVMRAQTIFGQQENLVLPYREARYRYLKVTVRGAGAQVQPEEVTGYLPALVFRAQPGARYRLYYGNPEAAGKAYPSESFADAYSPLAAGPGALGPVTDLRPPPDRPDFLKPGARPDVKNPSDPRITYALWGALGLLIVGMGAAVLKVFSQLMAKQKDKGV